MEMVVSVCVNHWDPLGLFLEVVAAAADLTNY